MVDVAYVDNGRIAAASDSSSAVEEVNIQVEGSYGTKVGFLSLLNPRYTVHFMWTG